MTSRSTGRAASFAVLGFLALAALLPLAAADHAYSHRYVIYGRVVDAENDPVPGLTVDFGFEPPFKSEGQCANQPGTETEAFGPTRTSPVTNQLGEFTFCSHTHSMSRGTPGTGTIRIDSLDVEETFTFDGFMRYSFIPIKLDRAHPSANGTALDQTYTVLGRVWRASDSEIKVETISVYGDTIQNTDFELTVAFDGEEPRMLTGRTNGYGDFAMRVPVSARPTGGEVTLKIDNRTFSAPVDPETGVTHIRGQIGDLKTTPGAPLVAAIGVVAVAAFALRRR